MKKIIVCKLCKKSKPIHCRGLCNTCYKQELYARKPHLLLKKRECDRRYCLRVRDKKNKDKRKSYHNNLIYSRLQRRIWNKFCVYVPLQTLKDNKEYFDKYFEDVGKIIGKISGYSEIEQELSGKKGN